MLQNETIVLKGRDSLPFPYGIRFSCFCLVWLIPVWLLLPICSFAQKATLVLHNAEVYTVNSKQARAAAVAVAGDRIIYVGSNEGALALADAGTERVDCGGKFLMPGLIEGHGHIHGMAESLVSLNLMKARDWEEILRMVADAVRQAKPGDWIVGRGWHQEKWAGAPMPNHLGYPYHESLDKVSPQNPVLLTHASGHSSYVNARALQEAGITRATPNPSGGDIVKDGMGRLVGVLEERAQGLVAKVYTDWANRRPESERKAAWRHSIGLAEQECLRQGVTSFVDAGSGFQEVDWMREMAREGRFRIRHWVMVRSNLRLLQQKQALFPILNEGGGYLTVNALKVSLDGALGSYGAWLLAPYTDRKDFYGQNTFSISELKDIADFAWKKKLQLCVHAIGDRANRETVDIFARQIGTDRARDHRWRIEHAQHVHPSEIPRFREWGIIASMQGIHCTSDAPFVTRRLGEKRAAEGAYMWRAFLDAGVVVNNGTDVPVEDIDPFANIYASVTRRRTDGLVFYPDQRMTRAEALYSYTLANAYAIFEEKEKGSLEVGKLADIILLSNDLIQCRDEDIAGTRVLLTVVGGQVRYKP